MFPQDLVLSYTYGDKIEIKNLSGIVETTTHPSFEKLNDESKLTFLRQKLEDQSIISCVLTCPNRLEYVVVRHSRRIEVVNELKSGKCPGKIKFDEYLDKDREIALMRVTNSAYQLEHLKHFNDDKEIVIAACTFSISLNVFNHASERLKDNFKLVNIIVQKNPTHIRYASERLRRKKHFIEMILELRPSLLEYFPIDAINTRDIALRALSRYGYLLEKFTDFQDDYDAVFAAVKNEGLALEFASKRLRDNDVIVYNAIKEDGCAIEFASERLRNNDDIVHTACDQNGHALRVVPDKYRLDRTYAKHILANYGCALESLQIYSNDDEMVAAAVNKCGCAIRFASDRLKNDEVIALNFAGKPCENICPEEDACYFEYFGEQIKNNPEIRSLAEASGHLVRIR